ncbi:hypothetical protein BGZ63DRAFT_209297 [Mariannaea sp. PMI_226]|nr:hypothetical protein BGZ63DRAFT_209297 [Mariannaea sp. PMI_226]
MWLDVRRVPFAWSTPKEAERGRGRRVVLVGDHGSWQSMNAGGLLANYHPPTLASQAPDKSTSSCQNEYQVSNEGGRADNRLLHFQSPKLVSSLPPPKERKKWRGNIGQSSLYTCTDKQDTCVLTHVNSTLLSNMRVHNSILGKPIPNVSNT